MTLNNRSPQNEGDNQFHLLRTPARFLYGFPDEQRPCRKQKKDPPAADTGQQM
jgi:hypothetical protein